jgi:hypothetical protein
MPSRPPAETSKDHEPYSKFRNIETPYSKFMKEAGINHPFLTRAELCELWLKSKK